MEDGGLLGKIHAIQNPADCSSSSTRFLVWQSMKNNKKDTRGLTAWYVIIIISVMIYFRQ